jgi:hypothetical protein
MRAMRPTISLPASVVLLFAIASLAMGEIADRLDEKAKAISCTTWWNGDAPKLAKLKGRVVVLHIHDPTRISSKAFEEKAKQLARSHADQPFTFIEVIVDCDEVDAQSYVARSGADWLVGFDGKGDTASGYPGSSVPRTYVIGPDGLVAWHAHIGALKPDVLDAQFARARFFDIKALPKKAKAAAKAAREYRFGAAVEESDKILASERSTPEEKAIAEVIIVEVGRYHAFQKKVARAAMKDLDWGVALKRVERMQAVYRGTAFADEVAAERKKLDSNPRVAYIAEAERMMEGIIDKTDVRRKRDLESAIRELTTLADSYANSKPAEKAQSWISDFEKRLAAMRKK